MQSWLVGQSPMDGLGLLATGKGAVFATLWVGSHSPGSRKSCRRGPVTSAFAANGEQDHYAVLGISSCASPADIKRAYRLLARKYHPDVSKDLKACEIFKSIRQAYEVLSDERTRAMYDETLRFQEIVSKPRRRNYGRNPEYDEGIGLYHWNELRQRMMYEKHKQECHDSEEDFSSDDESETYKGMSADDRGSFVEVLKSAFFTVFFMQTLGARVALALCGLAALLDEHLDVGYKLGFLTAWVLGGQGGILLSLSLSLVSWLCGKTSSNMVALWLVAVWVGTILTRFTPFPPGAVLTLLYMCIKLQIDLN